MLTFWVKMSLSFICGLRLKTEDGREELALWGIEMLSWSNVPLQACIRLKPSMLIEEDPEFSIFGEGEEEMLLCCPPFNCFDCFDW